jgi:hypothetical protein
VELRPADTMPDSIQQEARQILDSIAFTPFEQCQPLSRDFDMIPTKVGLYSFRHHSEGLLLGKPKICETGCVVDTKPFSGVGSIDMNLMK